MSDIKQKKVAQKAVFKTDIPDRPTYDRQHRMFDAPLKGIDNYIAFCILFVENIEQAADTDDIFARLGEVPLAPSEHCTRLLCLITVMCSCRYVSKLRSIRTARFR